MIAATDRVIQLDDGARTHLTQWGDSGPILLCVHGITSSRMTWWRFAEHFAASYRVFAYDQRGHGDSASVNGPMTLERSLRDLADITAAIGEPIHALIGHSWGGAVVIRGGREVAYERVVAIDPMVKVIPGTWFTEFVDDLREPFSIAPGEREPVIREFYKSLPEIEIEGKIHAMRSMTIDPIVNLAEVNGVEEGKWDLSDDLVAYPKPLWLAIAGVESVMSGEDIAHARELGGPHVRIDVFEGEGHSLQRTAFETFAERLNEVLAPETRQ